MNAICESRNGSEPRHLRSSAPSPASGPRKRRSTWTSFDRSGASPIATRCWAAPTRPKNEHGWQPAAPHECRPTYPSCRRPFRGRPKRPPRCAPRGVAVSAPTMRTRCSTAVRVPAKPSSLLVEDCVSEGLVWRTGNAGRVCADGDRRRSAEGRGGAPRRWSSRCPSFAGAQEARTIGDECSPGSAQRGAQCRTARVARSRGRRRRRM